MSDRKEYLRIYNATRRKELKAEKKAAGTYKPPKRSAEARRRDRKIRKIKLRLRAMQAICGPFPKCLCCGEDTDAFLQIHHMNGDGKEHRKQRFRMGVYVDIINDSSTSSKYQVLCANCHQAITILGYCPKHGKGKS